MEYAGHSDADARRWPHSGVSIVQPNPVSMAAEHSNHLTGPQIAVTIAVLQPFRFPSLTTGNDRSFLAVWLGTVRQLLRR